MNIYSISFEEFKYKVSSVKLYYEPQCPRAGNMTSRTIIDMVIQSQTFILNF